MQYVMWLDCASMDPLLRATALVTVLALAILGQDVSRTSMSVSCHLPASMETAPTTMGDFHVSVILVSPGAFAIRTLTSARETRVRTMLLALTISPFSLALVQMDLRIQFAART